MGAGDYNRTITFQRKTIAYDTVNKPIETWADAFTVWAGVITSGGKEFYAAQKKNEETTAIFKIRYRSDISTKMRIKYANSIYEILPPINDVNARHIELLISAKEVV